MEFFDLLGELFTHSDLFLTTISQRYGWLVYAAVFLIFLLETGVVPLAFLPGDSLLLVAGTVAAAGTLSPWGLIVSVILGACLGNTLGFHLGRWFGARIYDGSLRWIDPAKLGRAHDFYQRHGGKTIVLARFVPIVRAFAPLVAGAADMGLIRFESFSAFGAALWAGSLIWVGYLFGHLPFVRDNLTLILLLGVVAAALGPATVALLWKLLRDRLGPRR